MRFTSLTKNALTDPTDQRDDGDRARARRFRWRHVGCVAGLRRTGRAIWRRAPGEESDAVLRCDCGERGVADAYGLGVGLAIAELGREGI